MLRLVSLEGSITAALAALGRLDWLVGVGKHDARVLSLEDRQRIEHLPRLPCTWAVKALDVEPLNADLVLASIPVREKSLSEFLQGYLDTLILMPTDLESVYRGIRILGHVAAAERRALEVIDEMKSAFAAVAAAVGSLPRKKVYVEVWPKPYMNGPTWVAELVEMFNASFVPRPADRKEIAEQEIIKAAPDVIIVTWPGVDDPPLERIYQREAWGDVPAIRNERVRMIREIWVNSPGPNLAQGAVELAEAIHGVSLDRISS